jgi:hypothetical protein
MLVLRWSCRPFSTNPPKSSQSLLLSPVFAVHKRNTNVQMCFSKPKITSAGFPKQINAPFTRSWLSLLTQPLTISPTTLYQFKFTESLFHVNHTFPYNEHDSLSLDDDKAMGDTSKGRYSCHEQSRMCLFPTSVAKLRDLSTVSQPDHDE